MTFDWNVELHENFDSMIKEIDNLTMQIDIKKNEIRTAQRENKPNKTIVNLKQERKTLENKQKQIAGIVFEKICNINPYFNANWKALSSLYLQNKDSVFAKFVRNRYFELQYGEEDKITIPSGLSCSNVTDIFTTLLTPPIDISLLPGFSFFLQFTFTLAKPYISRDDEEFYIIDNPVRKDKVFKIPMVPGSSWKGNMRWVAMKIFTDNVPKKISSENLNDYLELRAQLVRLFGHENEAIENYLDNILTESFYSEDEKKQPDLFKEKRKKVTEKFKRLLIIKDYKGDKVEGRRGRLNFYPTFFNQIGLEVINPHDRKTKAGTLPIYIECVPEGANGTFSLLYVPFDLMGRPQHIAKDEVIEDLDLVCSSIKEMMMTYGFSAKKSSGFGIIKSEMSNIILKMNGVNNDKDKKATGNQEIKKGSVKSFKDLIKAFPQAEETQLGSFDYIEELVKSLIDKLQNSIVPGGSNG